MKRNGRTEEDYKDLIQQEKERLEKAKTILEKIRAECDEEAIARLKKKIDNVAANRNRISNQMMVVEDEHADLFLDLRGGHYRYNRAYYQYDSCYGGVTTNIREQVRDAIKKHTKISKIKRPDLCDYIDTMIFESYGNDERYKSMKKRYDASFAETNMLVDQLKKLDDELEQAKSVVQNIQWAINQLQYDLKCLRADKLKAQSKESIKKASDAEEAERFLDDRETRTLIRAEIYKVMTAE